MKPALPINLVRIEVFADATGYTLKAVQEKIRTGVWVQGRQWHKAPDGHILVDLEGYHQWAKGETAAA